MPKKDLKEPYRPSNQSIRQQKLTKKTIPFNNQKEEAMHIYLIAFVVQLLFLLVYFKVARYFEIVDRPNRRSSHYVITIRGGGIIFPIAAFLWFFMLGYNHQWIFSALLLISAFSFYDDIKPLSFIIRILIQFLAVTILFWQLHLTELPWYGILIIYLLSIGWLNAFNFMDGINGITAIYGLVALGTLAWLNHNIDFVSQQLILILIISVLLFSFFNVRNKAKIFAGDVGSISIAFLLAWFIILLIQKTGHIEYILLFAVYGIDSVITILFRLRRRENIFKAHRSHLYQYLSNELKWPHLIVSCMYGIVQLGINILTIKLISAEKISTSIFTFFFLVLCLVYLIIRFRVLKKLQTKPY